MNNNEQDKIISFSNILNAEGDIFPILSSEDERDIDTEEVNNQLPILPLRNMVLFPGIVTNITVGREKSLQLIKAVNKGDKFMGILAQKDEQVDDPKQEDLYEIGTVARILKMLNMPDGNTIVIIQGRKRFRLEEIVQEEPYDIGRITPLNNANKIKDANSFDPLLASVKDLAIQIIRKSPQIPKEAEFALNNIESPKLLVNYICGNLNIEVAEKQKILEFDSIEARARVALKELTKEMQLLELKNEIQNKVKTDLDKQQRTYFLNQQMKTIREELGDNNQDQEIEELKKKAKSKKWPKNVQEVFDKELSKLQRINPAAMEYSIQLNYLDTLLSLPWNEYTKDNFNLNKAEKILNRDHFGLEEVKKRIIEYLAVLKLKSNMKSPILALVGPPGVGKTSLGKSIAEALGRKYIRMSLGGLRDEAEIRGHRKTYIGAMPGRIIQSIKKAGSSNPVFVLDEIDKVAGATINGDPSSALLEVLDPEQNTAFYDNFLEVDYDLSHVMFVATANSINHIHPALRDRMEIINVPGYLQEEKYQIAKKHLVPKILVDHGMKKTAINFKKSIIEDVIDNYTRESGVRNLEKTLAKLVRNKAVSMVKKEEFTKDVTSEDVRNVLGIPRFEREKNLKEPTEGVVTGLAWTPVGGDILFVEASLSKGKGRLTLTGNLGDVMKESATLALEYLKANAEQIGIDVKQFEENNVHIHVPEGATPKDGPSAGITMFTAVSSVLLQKKVRNDVAMTGEITLRGKVTPVGGIKEKILAAKRSGIKTIILSESNRKNIEDINEKYLKGLTFKYVENMSEVLELAFEK